MPFIELKHVGGICVWNTIFIALHDQIAYVMYVPCSLNTALRGSSREVAALGSN